MIDNSERKSKNDKKAKKTYNKYKRGGKWRGQNMIKA